jgi:hypothetical protein
MVPSLFVYLYVPKYDDVMGPLAAAIVLGFIWPWFITLLVINRLENNESFFG